MNPHRTRFSTFFRLFLIASGMLFAAGVAGAAEYRWTNADGDGYWSTLGNWQVNSGGSWIAAEHCRVQTILFASTTPPAAVIRRQSP